jgi:dipeptidyl aminopeptidase/acylaminoacyl peptidase
MSVYGFRAPSAIVAVATTPGANRLLDIDTASGTVDALDTPYTSIASLRANGQNAAFIAASATESAAVVLYTLRSGEVSVLRRASQVMVPEDFISMPRPIEFPTKNGKTAFAFYYPPANPEYEAPPGELPPLIVRSHGGPTGAVSNSLNLSYQYWTSRGFALVDVNYGGSTGYGREYRERLKGQWGVVDIDDCVAAAEYLAEQGLADPRRLAISGGSAGGYTTLGALAFRDAFAAGASHFGVADLETFIRDTHKFESHYLESLVGPYPERSDLFHDRSPIHFADQISCPVILFQGLEDRVVPPSQAEVMVEALRRRGVPVAYLPFAGEGHGFRQAGNIRRTLEAELFFLGRIFGFTPADDVQPVPIENLA